jgi:small subunit ribosomal protein S4
MQLKKGDVVSIREKSRGNEELKAIVESNKNKTIPGWLDVDREKMEITVTSFPTREEIPFPVEEHLVVELYSK